MKLLTRDKLLIVAFVSIALLVLSARTWAAQGDTGSGTLTINPGGTALPVSRPEVVLWTFIRMIRVSVFGILNKTTRATFESPLHLRYAKAEIPAWRILPVATLISATLRAETVSRTPPGLARLKAQLVQVTVIAALVIIA